MDAIVLLFMALAQFGDSPDLPEAKSSERSIHHLAGKWSIVDARQANKSLDDVVGSVILFNGTNMTMSRKNSPTERFTFALIPNTNGIDYWNVGRGLDAVPVRAIYKITGDRLVFAIGQGERPKEFNSPAGSAVILFECKRLREN